MATQDALRRGIQQYEASTGRRISPEALQALLAAQLDVEANRQAQNKQLELQQQQMDINKENARIRAEEAAAQAEAAKASGIAQLGQTAITGAALLKDTSLGKAISGGAKKAIGSIGSVFSSGEVGGGPAALSGGSAGSPSASLAAAEATGTVGTAATSLGGGPAALAGGSAGSAPASLAAAEAGSGAGTSAGAGGGASGVGAAAGIAALVAADQMLANRVGKFESPQERWEMNVRGITRYGGISPGAATFLEKWTGAGNIPSSPIEKIVAAGTAGTIPDFLGGSQENFVPNLADIADNAGTVICTELNRQGFMPDEILRLDSEYSKNHVDSITYEGYLWLASPIVRKMKKSKFVTKLVKPIGLAWANEMAHRIDKTKKGSFGGCVILWVGVPICKALGYIRRICHG